MDLGIVDLDDGPELDLAGEYSLRQELGEIQTQLSVPGTTEVCVNVPGWMDVERNGVWRRIAAPSLTLDALTSIAILAGQLTGKEFGPSDPIVYTRLPGNERLTVVGPPVVGVGLVVLVIRRRERRGRSFDELCDGGLFDDTTGASEGLSPEDEALLELYDRKAWREFFKLAIRAGKNIMLAGKPGAGKTTTMEAMIPLLPLDWRIITAEDTPELLVPHPNAVQLYFDRKAKGRGQVGADDLMELVLRMYGRLVLFGELRGAEAVPYVNCIAAGNKGITTLHAGSVREVFTIVPLLMRKHPAAANIRDETLRDWTREVVDVAAHFERRTVDGVQRYRCSQVYFKPAAERARRSSGGGF